MSHTVLARSPSADDWMKAIAGIFRSPKARVNDDTTPFARIVNAAREVSGADFVVLYDFDSATCDVGSAPTFAGSVVDASRIAGVETPANRQSPIFRVLERGGAFYAESAADDWKSARLVDSSSSQDDQTFFFRESVLSSAAVPLTWEGETMGLLFINYHTKLSFGETFRASIEQFSKIAALAVATERHFHRSERYRRSVEALNEIGREIGSADSLKVNEIGALIERLVLTAIPCQNLFICLFDESTKRLVLVHHKDKHDDRVVNTRELQHGLAAYVFNTGEPLLANRKAQNELFRTGAASLVGRPSAVWLGVPMIARHRRLGVIVVQDYEDEGSLDTEHLGLLSAIANQTAAAINGLQLLGESNRRLEELAILLELSQAFGADDASDGEFLLRDRLGQVLNRLCDFEGCDGSILFLRERGQRGQLSVFAASKGLEMCLGDVWPAGEGLAGMISSSSIPLIENDYANWSGRSTSFERLDAGTPTRVCGVPLLWRDRVLGVITLSANAQSDDFSSEHLETLQRIAGAASIGLKDMRASAFRRVLIDGGPNAIVAATTSGELVTFNDEAARVFGRRRKDVLGKQASSLYWGGRDEALRINDLLETSNKTAQEIFGRTAADEKIPLSLTAAVLREGSEIVGSVGVLEDLRLNALRGRNRRLVDALGEFNRIETLPDLLSSIVLHAVDLLYADAGCVYLVQGDSFTPRAEEGYGGALPDRLLAQSTLERVAHAASGVEPIFFRSDAISSHSPELLVGASSAVLLPIRSDLGALAVLLAESRDVSHFETDVVLLEVLASQAASAISRVQLAEEKNVALHRLIISANAIAVGHIAAGFVHETKNLLSAVGLIAHNLARDLRKESAIDEKTQTDFQSRIQRMKGEIDRMDELSRRLERLTKQGLYPQKQSVYLNDVVRHSLELLDGTLRGKELKVDCKFDSALDRPSIGEGSPSFVDPSQIQQAVMNLVLNAVAASSDRGKLQIQTRRLSTHVEVQITDYGSGISERARRQIFAPLFTTKTEGTGLGLFVTKLLVEKNHDGTIEIGNPGKGAVFTIRLPR